MSKIRQAVEYERTLTDEKVKAHIELTEVQLKAEQDLRAMADMYERKYTDGQFGQLQLVAEEHRLFHEREHLLYEDAIEKASASITATLNALQLDVDRFRDEANKWLTVDRFEREHQNLAEKTTLAIETLEAKIGVEERTSLRQATKDEVLEAVRANQKDNERWQQSTQRWQIGTVFTVAIFGITTLLHLFKVI